MERAAGGHFELSPELRPGLYAYRFWPLSEGGGPAQPVLDDDPAHPLRTFVSGQPFSELWIRDCRYPVLRLAESVRGDPSGSNPSVHVGEQSGSLTLGLEFVPGEDSFQAPEDAAPNVDGASIRLRWPGEPNALLIGVRSAPDESTWELHELPEGVTGSLVAQEDEGGQHYLEVALEGLPRARLRLEVSLADRSGRSTGVDRTTPHEPGAGYLVADAPLRVPVHVGVPPLQTSVGLTYHVIAGTFRFEAGDPVPALHYPEHTGDRGGQPPPAARAEGVGLADITRAVQGGYFADLGVDTILLAGLSPQADAEGCVNDTADGDSGWFCGRTLGTWPVAPRQVDPALGGEAALRQLVAAAHATGMHVVVTVQANHLHQRHSYAAPGHLGWLRDPPQVCSEESFPVDNPEDGGADEELFPADLLTCSLRPFLSDIDWSHPVGARRLREDLLWWVHEMDVDGLLLDDVKHVPDHSLRNLAARAREVLGQGPGRPMLWGETATNWLADGCRPLGEPVKGYERIMARLDAGLLDAQLDTPLLDAIEQKCSVFGEQAGGHGAYWTERSIFRLSPYERMMPHLSSPDRQLVALSLRGVPEAQERQLLGLTWVLSLPGRPLILAGDELGPAVLEPTGAAERPAAFARIKALSDARRLYPQLAAGQWRRLTRSNVPETMGALRNTTVGGREQYALVLVNVSDADKELRVDGTVFGPTEEEVVSDLPAGASGCYQDLLRAPGDDERLVRVEAGAVVPLPKVSAALLVPGEGCPQP